MPKYSVEIPIAGSVIIEVEADNPNAAKVAAWEAIDNGYDIEDSLQWEYHQRLTTGNVLHASCNEISVEELDE